MTNTERTEERKNRFNGESVMLTKEEARRHDLIFMAEMMAELHSDPEIAAKKMKDKEVRRQRAVAAYRLEEARLRKEHSKITSELEELYAKVKSGKITGKDLAEMQDRIRELEQSLALDMDMDD